MVGAETYHDIPNFVKRWPPDPDCNGWMALMQGLLASVDSAWNRNRYRYQQISIVCGIFHVFCFALHLVTQFIFVDSCSQDIVAIPGSIVQAVEELRLCLISIVCQHSVIRNVHILWSGGRYHSVCGCRPRRTAENTRCIIVLGLSMLYRFGII